MDERLLPDGFPLGLIEKKTFGRVYMQAVEHEFHAKHPAGQPGRHPEEKHAAGHPAEKHPGRAFDDALWEACGLSVIYLEGDEDYFHLDDFIRKMGLDEAAIKAECEAQGFDYARELGK